MVAASSGKVDRLVAVLEYLLSGSGSGRQLSEIAARLSGPLSSTHDLLKSMVLAGLLQVDSRKAYRVGPTFTRLAMSAVNGIGIRAVADPYLHELARTVEYDTYLAVRSGFAVTYVERVATSRRAGLDIKLGEPVPLHSSAVGKLFTAFEPDLARTVLAGALERFTASTIISTTALERELHMIRERRFSISHQETISGVIGFAAPVWGRPGDLLAAVHVSAFKDSLMDSDYLRVEAEARRCAELISHALGAPPLDMGDIGAPDGDRGQQTPLTTITRLAPGDSAQAPGG